jgi:hypothetical protein
MTRFLLVAPIVPRAGAGAERLGLDTVRPRPMRGPRRHCDFICLQHADQPDRLPETAGIALEIAIRKAVEKKLDEDRRDLEERGYG